MISVYEFDHLSAAENVPKQFRNPRFDSIAKTNGITEDEIDERPMIKHSDALTAHNYAVMKTFAITFTNLYSLRLGYVIFRV